MSMRRNRYCVANWKMNFTISDVKFFMSKWKNKTLNNSHIKTIFCPSFTELITTAELLHNSNSLLGAQNVCYDSKGAFTGEVSSQMIISSNGDYVIIGHSERREYFTETNADMAEKVNRALANNLKVIFCCGESLRQRKDEIHFDWIKKQLSEGLFHLSVKEFVNIVIAYEPIWAIGTGITATSEQAQDMHQFIRNFLSEKYGSEVAENISILYGGSCNPTNAKELFSQTDIDGGLIGGASLKSDDFLSIINSF